MAVRFDLTLDCANATRLAAFWKLALGYQDEPPPAPFATRQEWLQAADPEANPDDGAWLCDPDGVGPRLSLLRVPEPKAAKNRLHLDLRADGCSTVEELQRLCDLGARRVDVGQAAEVSWVVLADPEGNEFCLLARTVQDMLN